MIQTDQLVTNYPRLLRLGKAGSGKSALLSYLCLMRLRTKRPRLPSFGVSADDASEVILETCLHHGILTKMTEETYGFGHLALQEFLTGKWYSNERRWERLIKRHILIDPWWQNAIAFCFASLSSATNAMTALWEFQDISEMDRMKLISNCLRLDPTISAQLRKKFMRILLNWYHNGNADQHNAALYMLIGIEDSWSAQGIRYSLGGFLPTRALAKILARGPISTNWDQ